MDQAETIQDVRASITELPAPGTLTRRGFVAVATGALLTVAGCGRNQELPNSSSSSLPVAETTGAQESQTVPCPADSEFNTPLPRGAKYFRGNPNDPYYIGVKDMLSSGQHTDIQCQLEKLQEVPVGDWYGSWNKDVAADVRTSVQDARNEGKMPILVAYNIPKRDIAGGHSEGGSATASEYLSWVRQFSEGIGDGDAVVILEPDALAQSVAKEVPPEEGKARRRLLGKALKIFHDNNPNAVVYLDVGNADWLPPKQVAELLHEVDGDTGVLTAIVGNVASFGPSDKEAAYLDEVARIFGRELQKLVDNSRNGAHVENREKPWNNPQARVGKIALAFYDPKAPVTYVHVKQAGRSDGNKHNPEQAPDGEFDSRLLRQQLGIGDPNSPYAK